MSTRVLAVQLEPPYPALDELAGAGYARLQALVFDGDAPLGYVHLELEPGRRPDDGTLRAAIQDQLGGALARAAAARELLPLDGAEAPLPTLTVAICTRNRAQSLRRALESVVALDYPRELLEILVVDNAPDDDATTRVVAAFPQARYVREPRPGLDWARNRAIAESLGEVIAYTDDDVVVDRRWARAIARHMTHPAVMAVTGLVAPAELAAESQRLFEAYGGFGRGFERRYYTLGVRRHWAFWPLSAGVIGTGCNMAFRRALFASVGGFDPALDVGTPTRGAGDHDMFYRTLRAGHVLVYEPAALVWHYHRADYAALRRQMNDFGRGVYAFWAKTLLVDRPMRPYAAAFALIWFVQWFARRLVRPRGLPRDLVRAEAIGALQGPMAYLLARRHARWIARSTASPCPPS